MQRGLLVRIRRMLLIRAVAGVRVDLSRLVPSLLLRRVVVGLRRRCAVARRLHDGKVVRSVVLKREHDAVSSAVRIGTVTVDAVDGDWPAAAAAGRTGRLR
jgi:hypothetical protein